jgi:hypothetical protein
VQFDLTPQAFQAVVGDIRLGIGKCQVRSLSSGKKRRER